MKKFMLIFPLAMLMSCAGTRHSLHNSASCHAVGSFRTGVSATDASLQGVEITMSDTIIRIDRMTLHRTDSACASFVACGHDDESVREKRSGPAGSGRLTLLLLGAACAALLMAWLAGRR